MNNLFFDDLNEIVKLDSGNNPNYFCKDDIYLEKKYNDLNNQYTELLENNKLTKENNKLIKEKNKQLEDDIEKLKEQYDKINKNQLNLRILILSIIKNTSLDKKK